MKRWKVVAVATVVLGATAALAIALTRGGSTHVSWAPTEGRTPISEKVIEGHTYTVAQAVKAGIMPSLKEQLQDSGLPLCGTKPPTSGKALAAYRRAVARNDGDTCMADPRGITTSTGGSAQSTFALNARPNGNDTLRYVDPAGWAIVYPRDFHGLAQSSGWSTAGGADTVFFSNFAPVPLSPGPPVRATGIVFAITSSWNHVEGPFRLGHDSRFPLHLPSPPSFRIYPTGSRQSAEFDFQGNGVGYHASVEAGPEASRADLEALERMVESISFRPRGRA